MDAHVPGNDQMVAHVFKHVSHDLGRSSIGFGEIKGQSMAKSRSIIKDELEKLQDFNLTWFESLHSW